MLGMRVQSCDKFYCIVVDGAGSTASLHGFSCAVKVLQLNRTTIAIQYVVALAPFLKEHTRVTKDTVKCEIWE